MRNVHPIFRAALSPYAPKQVSASRLDELLVPCEVDISTGQYAEPLFVTPDEDTVKHAAAEVLEKHAGEFDEAIARLLRQQHGVVA
jgi:hypothetical protein